MKKIIFLIFISIVQLSFAQEARQYFKTVDSFEIEGYGTIEGQIHTIISNVDPPYRQDLNRPIKERIHKNSTLEMTYTNSETGEHRVFKCDSSNVDYLFKQFHRLDSLVKDSTSVRLGRTGIEKKTLTPPVILSDDGVESTYTEEYSYKSDPSIYGGSSFTIGVYTAGKDQAVWYYQFGNAETTAERNTWRILTNENEKASFVEWLEKARKAM